MSGEQAAFEASSFEHNDVAPAVTVPTSRVVRVWPDLTTEVLAIRGQTDALALRPNPDSKIVWKRDGDRAFVLEGLLGGILAFGLRSQP